MKKIILQWILFLSLASIALIPFLARSYTFELKAPITLETIYTSNEFKELYFRFYPQRTELDLRLNYLSRIWDVSYSLVSAITFCESNHNVLAISKTNDFGLWQINHVWDGELKKLGLDRKDENDNIIAGFYILKNYGTWPWKASQKCWKKLI